MNLSDEVLMAYADGELDDKARSEVEQAMAVDPQVAQRVAQHKALRDKLRVGYAKVLEEPVPDRLLAVARARAVDRRADLGAADRSVSDRADRGAGNGGANRTDNVIPLRRKQGPAGPAVPYWGAIAASFVVGALVWHFGAQLYSPAPVAEHNGELLASGALDRALSTQLVKDQDARSAVQIGVSFRSKQGNFCRTFRLQSGGQAGGQGSANLTGLACRQQDQWKLEMLAQSGGTPGGQPEYRPAGSSLPPAIAQAVEQAIDGDPLDAEAELQAKNNQWRNR